MSKAKTLQTDISMIKEVYLSNFREEIQKISNLIDEFPIISLDTEFPGCLYTKETHPLLNDYKILKCNVDTLKPIQIGLTLSDKNGFYPIETCTWQFNLQFDVNRDLSQPESIDFLVSSGIDFNALSKTGIPNLLFGEELITSGIVLNADVQWVVFHGIYDFAYLLRCITNLPLAEDEKRFNDDLRLYFRNYYDTRQMMEYSNLFCSGLSRLAKDLGVERVGSQHQAGSDSMITLQSFLKLVILLNDMGIGMDVYRNNLFKYETDIFTAPHKNLNMPQILQYGNNPIFLKNVYQNFNHKIE